MVGPGGTAWAGECVSPPQGTRSARLDRLAHRGQERRLVGVGALFWNGVVAAIAPAPGRSEDAAADAGGRLAPADTAPRTQADDDGFFEVSVDSNPLALEPRQALMDDRRFIAEKAANDAAITVANANAFNSRSSHAAAWAVGGGGRPRDLGEQRRDRAPPRREDGRAGAGRGRGGDGHRRLGNARRRLGNGRPGKKGV